MAFLNCLMARVGLLTSLILLTSVSQAQAPVTGVTVPPLPEQSVNYETGEGLDIKVSVVARGLDHPWGFVSLPDGSILVSERGNGQLRVIRDGVMSPDPVAGLPEVRAVGYTGLLDIVMHPDYADNHLLYLSYNKPISAEQSSTVILRGTWDGQSLHNVEDIFVADSGVASVASLVFDREGFLYVSFYGGSDDAQDLSLLTGKVLRLTDSGDIPADNPFVNVPGARAEIFTLGHRTIQGMELHPESGDIWSLEMGPNGGDEVNILKSGANYGWPQVSLGRNYTGPWQSSSFQKEGFEDPVVYWMPSISVSGMTFYTGDKFPGWQGDLFIGGLRMGEIPATGHLQRVRLNADGEETRREMLLVDLRQRIRGAYQGQDGFLYVLTDADDGALLKIEPLQ